MTIRRAFNRDDKLTIEYMVNRTLEQHPEATNEEIIEALTAAWNENTGLPPDLVEIAAGYAESYLNGIPR